MNKFPLRSALLVMLAFSLVLPAVAGDRPALPERYRKWLDEEVVYIISPLEKDVFLKLKTDGERDLFIDAFWKHRDPNPDSPENEFRTEHERRIEHANRFFGRDTPVPGWKTDRGRIYILLGEPGEIQRFLGRPGVYDCESWFYQGKTDRGLPAAFYLLFFREHGQGAFKLYSPLRDGPQALRPSSSGDPGDYAQALRALRDVEPSLAAIAESLVPGEEGDIPGRPSMASDLLLERIQSLPSRETRDTYARRFLEYKDRVEVEYTANYLDSDSLVKVFKEASGPYFVHYAVEPRRLSVNQYEGRYSTTLEVNGRVTTLDGRLVYQFDRNVPLEISEARMAELSLAPFDYHDLFPLVAGDYRLSILLKNEASKEFTSLEKSIRVPPDGPAPELTQPLLGYKVERFDPGQKKIRAFRVGPYQVFCQPGRIFTAGDTLAVVFQVDHLSPEAAAGGRIRIAFVKDGQPFREIVRRPADLPDLPTVLEEVRLAEFPPAHYLVRISVTRGEKESVSSEEEFDLTYAANVARPWSSSRVLPEAGDPAYSLILGAQLFNLGRYREALAAIERARERMPDSPGAAYNLAQVCVATGKYARAAEVLAPFLGRTPPAAYEFYVLAGEALRKAGDFGRAADVLNEAVGHYGVNASVLNALGESYLGLGKSAEARAAFEKSLELSPNQPDIRRKVADLKKENDDRSS
jgi:GWxTD domain-containing protein